MRIPTLVVSLCLCACTPATVKVWPSSGVPMGAGDDHVLVRAGDSLYGIAARNGVSVVDLAQANGIAEPFIIHPGDRLRLPTNASPMVLVTNATAPAVRIEALPESAVASKAKPVAAKPAAAAAHKPASSAAAMKTAGADNPDWRWPASGALVNVPARTDAKTYALDIAGTAGSPVRATAAGRVLYSGDGSPGYEQLIVIEHAGGFVSSYSHNRKRLVAEGQRVAAGAVIAEMGHAGAARDMVHFELRRAGQLVDPRTVLPPR